jgi:hypothetical protein
VHGWFTGRRKAWIPALVLFLAVREDAPIHAAGLGLATLAFERERRWDAVCLLAACLVVLVFDLKVAGPYFLAKTGSTRPEVWTYWAKYGSTPGEVIRSMLTRPWLVLEDLVTSSSWRFWVPALFLPLLSRRALVALLPGMLFFATSVQMRVFKGYSMAVLIPLLFWGIFDGARVLAKWLGPKRAQWPRYAMTSALLLVGVVNAPFLVVEPPRMDAISAWPSVYALLEGHKGKVCVQFSLYAHVPYENDATGVTDECLALEGAIGVVNPRFDTFPYTPEKVEGWIAEARAEGRFQGFPGGFAVLTPRGH